MNISRSLKDVEAAKKDTFVGNTVVIMYTKDKKIYKCRAEEKKIKELAELIENATGVAAYEHVGI